MGIASARATCPSYGLIPGVIGEPNRPRVNWAMYRELGFIRVWGKPVAGQPEHAYLIYPHQPIVAYSVQTGQPLSEHCVTFPDETRPYGSARLPDSDDVLAKWMALTGAEDRLIASANMHLPGRQMSLTQVTQDIWRLSRWERARATAAAAATSRVTATAAAPGARATDAQPSSAS